MSSSLNLGTALLPSSSTSCSSSTNTSSTLSAATHAPTSLYKYKTAQQTNAAAVGKHLLLMMGVRIIWVNDKQRRNGIAQRLLNTARQYYMFGTSVDKTSIAFSQPTEDGFKFAASYTKSPTGTVIAY